MNFKGVSVTFDCKDGAQYEAIGQFWDMMTQQYPKSTLIGLGHSWSNDQIDYAIGSEDLSREYDCKEIRAIYPPAGLLQMRLPDEGWLAYHGKLEDLTKLYEKIYEDGPLTYEIESFDDDGNADIRIFRRPYVEPVSKKKPPMFMRKRT